MRKNNTYCYLPSFQFVSVTSFTFSLATRHSVAYLGGLRGLRGCIPSPGIKKYKILGVLLQYTGTQ